MSDRTLKPASEAISGGLFFLALLGITFFAIVAMRQYCAKTALQDELAAERARSAALRKDLAGAVGEIEALRQQLPDRTAELF